MSKQVFDRIKAGLDEALEVARGNAKPIRIYIPPEISVRDVRTKLNLSQSEFSAVFGFTVNQIRDWEQGRTRPIGALRAYLLLIRRDPQKVVQLLTRKQPVKATA
jgi:putative transcriptional regulator